MNFGVESLALTCLTPSFMSITVIDLCELKKK